jgi:prepilin-type N-terminal cleavage/methylation domain-containing protein
VKWPARMPSEWGFTLIEVVIVVVILGVLAAIAMPRLTRTRDDAVLASMKSDLRSVVTTQEDFFADHHQTYALSVGPVASGTIAAFIPSASNLLTLSSVTTAGWAAEVTNATPGFGAHLWHLFRQRHSPERFGCAGLLLRVGPVSMVARGVPAPSTQPLRAVLRDGRRDLVRAGARPPTSLSLENPVRSPGGSPDHMIMRGPNHSRIR